MTEINHRYLKDNDGDTFYPVTHIDAVQGIDQESTDNALTDMNDKINQMNTLIDNANKTIEEQRKTIEKQKTSLEVLDTALGDMVGDTGWIDYQVHPNNTKNYISTGSPCAIREVRIGNSLMPHLFVFRSIRVNIGKIKHNTVVAQLPQGFTKDTVSFVIRSSGGKTPIEFSIEKDNSVKAFLYGNDSDLWAYGEYTWLV
ncbi:hypothetical protein [Staphylococcus sp. GDX8P106P-2]|uniref:hypothetical protein n=1 Tax=Staphylococcus sp. GDX8P106P-2 TaxID=2804108 RepID=UPI001AEC639E|nr:hypothetical protein [Staphylococcus sp. GDX8P106P-2]